MKGTDAYGAYRVALRPETTQSTQTTIDVTTYVDSDWAGCTTTKNSTTGFTITTACVAVQHYSWTQTRSHFPQVKPSSTQ